MPKAKAVGAATTVAFEGVAPALSGPSGLRHACDGEAGSACTHLHALPSFPLPNCKTSRSLGETPELNKASALIAGTDYTRYMSEASPCPSP
eukprot:CAMPEP_0174330442 /NCGR_PEP_ID=MMETSP0810-20121108/16683_1 /TAXON_ID=73025 ORGANISM="Eutreptiella gymnastica-like, Strain CCMP1594" /NCGR_SAMPLE_ID=MMETSP0810 /ASSEMBLY_ACC=CAM_ASM_000659 /LENGTH=91 /DNA_ID=CAMNT_0015445617 /DNA_START=196 /DNA_END=472 /DNA_ORIENTATION=+